MRYPCGCGGTVLVHQERGSSEYACCVVCSCIVPLAVLLEQAAPVVTRSLKRRAEKEGELNREVTAVLAEVRKSMEELGE